MTGHQAYQDRMAGNSNPLLMVSCHTGAPEKKEASKFTDALRQSGDHRLVYAPDSLASHGVMPDDQAVISVDRVNRVPTGYNGFWLENWMTANRQADPAPRRGDHPSTKANIG
ncbi:hypothetical protein FHR81_004825 [Actinoalloteichus hoggarensis]|uniref:hypothetical protein n=1 Tax=Actinoalloteichus hoggarensis TaxID=1470176 RepID=UPI0012FE79BF|nr:hypothetical protein [Actinoalloteichus hoggarensis]MBB5923752.1 hypothetical protein [Actinoalloteichus hoggarensis]